MTRSTLTRLGLTFAVAGAVLAACAGGGTTTSPSASAAPSAAASESASASATTESPSASASASASPSGSPAARTVQMYAIDGGFQNPPVDATPGTVLTFRNLGTEAHEMVVLKRNADATEEQTFEDLSKVDPADLMKFVTVVGVLAADPNSEATGQIELTEPGEYAVVDLLAKGTMTAPASPDPMAIPSGVPNVAEGMWTTFTVIEPEAS
jgi:plastocyanin